MSELDFMIMRPMQFCRLTLMHLGYETKQYQVQKVYRVRRYDVMRGKKMIAKGLTRHRFWQLSEELRANQTGEKK